MIRKLTTATLLAHGAAGRKLVSCNTAEVATCFESLEAGGDIDLVPGTLTSWDGIDSYFQIVLEDKHATITCSEDGGTCVWQASDGKSNLNIKNNDGTTTLRSITIKDGAGQNGGLIVQNSNVVLILVAFIDNAASNRGGAIYVHYSGSSSVTLHGCSFSGNTASNSAPDVYNNGETVVISGCPAGED